MVRLVTEAIDPGALAEAVRTDACGAVVTFVGVVRETSPDDPRRVEGITYEAYAAMAVPEMEAIAHEAEAAFGPLRIAVVHRTGTLALGEASVGIAVGAPHRGRAFDACEFAIDALKARVPIWKQEHYAAGGSAWRPNRIADAPPAERA